MATPTAAKAVDQATTSLRTSETASPTHQQSGVLKAHA